jgi:hypothetical protein
MGTNLHGGGLDLHRQRRFLGGKKPEQHPFYTIQGHVVYNFRPSMWIEDLNAGIGRLYDLDPDETTDVSARHPAVVDRLARALKTPSGGDPADLEAARQHLEVLGYLE